MPIKLKWFFSKSTNILIYIVSYFLNFYILNYICYTILYYTMNKNDFEKIAKAIDDAFIENIIKDFEKHEALRQ